MKRRIVTGIVVAALLLALIAGWALSQRSAKTTVTTAKAATQTLAVSVAASGRLVSPGSVTVSAPAAGTLATVAVRDGQQVAAGDTLATMDAAPLDLVVVKAEAAVASARAMPTGTDRLNAARTAAIKAADAALASARADRAKATIVAPAAGTVQLTSIALTPGTPALFETHAGASVTAGLPLFSIVDLGALQFEAEVDEADIAGVQADQAIHVVLDAHPGTTFQGKVTSVRTSSVTTSTGGIAFPVLATVDAAGARLLVGMSGDVTIDVASVADALVVPARSVVTDGATRYVWRVADGKVAKTEVGVGAATDALVQVTSGLSAGDVVALGNLAALTDGAAVDVQS